MSEARRVFISYAHVQNTQNGLPTASLGFGQMDVEIDFPIRNGEDLTRVVYMGCEKKGLQSMKIVVLSWQFFE